MSIPSSATIFHRFKYVVETFLGTPVGGHAARFANDKAFDPGAIGFFVLAINAVIANQRIRHANNLAGIGRIR